MATLISDFGLVFDQLVKVRISARNDIGQGPWSMINSQGAKIRVVP